MGFKVADRFRKNKLSLKPGGVTVVVEYTDGRRLSYDRIKYPESYIRKLKHNKTNIKDVYIKD